MLTALITLGFILLIMTCGWLQAHLYGVTNRIEKAGLSFLLGSWIMTLEMMMAYQITGVFSAVQTTTVLAVTTGILLALALSWPTKRTLLLSDCRVIWQGLLAVPTRFSVTQFKENFKGWAVAGVTGGLLLYTAWSNLTWPVSDWDAVALYDFRAILIKLVGHWQDGKPLGYFYQYPPFTSLLHGAIYQLGFERVKIVYTLLFVSFAAVYYVCLRRKVSQVQALMGVFLLTTAPLIWGHITIAYTNLSYTIFFVLGMLYAWELLESKSTKSLFLAMMCTTAALWVRQSEPFWLVVIAITLIGTWLARSSRMWLLQLGLLVVFGVLYKYWPMYVQSLELPPPPISVNDALGWSVPINLGTIIHHGFLVTDHFIFNVVKPIVLLLVPLVVLVWFDRTLMKQRSVRVALATIVVLFGIVFAGTYYFSFFYKSWNLIGESLTRLVMFIVPLMLYVISQSSFWPLLLDKGTTSRRKRG